MSTPLRLTVVGSSPAMPRPGGACSSYLIRSDSAAILLDIGSGALGKLHLATPYTDLDGVVISHMHADHFFDVVPLRHGLRYFSAPRPEKMPLWLPPGGAKALDALRQAVSTDAASDFFDEVFVVREYDPAETLRIKDVVLSFCPTRHYIEGYAIRAECNGASVAYSSDTAPCDAVVEHARASMLFLCEAALGLGTESGKRGHSSAHEAGEMAQRANVGMLALTHYSTDYSDDALVQAAQQNFGGPILLVNDGMELSV